MSNLYLKTVFWVIIFNLKAIIVGLDVDVLIGQNGVF